MRTDGESGEIRVWYIPQIPMPAYEVTVPDLITAEIVLDTLTSFSQFEYANRVKPDYSDAGGIVRFDAEAREWWDVEEDESFGAIR